MSVSEEEAFMKSLSMKLKCIALLWWNQHLVNDVNDAVHTGDVGRQYFGAVN